MVEYLKMLINELKNLLKCILFDLDGTLVDSLEDIACAMNAALEENGFPTHSTPEYAYFVGDGVRVLIERALPENQRDEKTILRIHKTYSANYDANYALKTKPYQGIPALLTQLKKMGMKLAVASNKPDALSQTLVRHFFDGIFDVVLGKRSDVPAKPNPQIVNDILKVLDAAPAECLFVGDTNVDIQTAKAAGLRSAGCVWGFRDYDELTAAGADYILNEPGELLHILKGAGKP